MPDIGDEIGRYRLVRLLGEGGAGRVFEARHVITDAAFAVKLLHPQFLGDQRMRRRMAAEARAGAMGHPNIVRIYDVEIDRPDPYIVMDLIDGPSVDDLVEGEGGRLDVARTVEIGLSVAAALAVAHAKDIVHRDVKPGNVLFDRPSGLYKLADFGIMRTVDHAATRASGNTQIVGSPQYMAPEQWDGTTSPRNDIYSLGATLYRLLAGRVDVAGNRPLSEVRPEVPATLGALIDAMMARDPSLRPATMQDVSAALMPFRSPARPPGSPLPEPDEPGGRSLVELAAASPRRPWAIGLVVLVLGSASIWYGLDVAREKAERAAIEAARRVEEARQAEEATKAEEARRAEAAGKAEETRRAEEMRTAVQDAEVAAADAERRREIWLAIARIPVTIAPKSDEDLGPGSEFHDCDPPACPRMVVVPAGSFAMGSVPGVEARDDDEGPQHRVTIERPFAVGKFEVTFESWDACVAEGGCRHVPDDSGWGRGNRPVVNVSWNDVRQQYLPWLRRKTGKPYRLLSEAEWEYAARAGTTMPFAFGATISTTQANYNGTFAYGVGQLGVYRQRTSEVGSFAANAFGLHDMHGNVWECVEDRYHENYDGAPTDGSARTSGAEARRVIRGGSWYGGPKRARSAVRGSSTPVFRADHIGFRVARPLSP